MKPDVWSDGYGTHVARTPEDAREIAEALLRATTEYPDSEFEVRFTEEDGVIRWFVKAKLPTTGLN